MKKINPNELLKIGIVLLIFSVLSSCKMSRFIFYGKADIDDYKIFKTRNIENSNKQFFFKKSKEIIPFDTLEYSIKDGDKKYDFKKTFEEILKENETTSFIVIRNDSLILEKYFNDYSKATLVNSFSTSKSILSLLIGIAIDDGYIKSVEEPITNYIPEFKKDGFDKIKIRNLLQMTSGIKFKEIYGPFTDAANLYYGRNIIRELGKLEILYSPDTKFNYSSGDSQIMGLVLSRALKDISLSEYLSNKVWKPLEMEFTANWSLDDKGLERAFCCINATAIDFAKIGRLYLNKGSWNENQIVSEKWIEQTTKYDESKKINPEKYYYNYNWYINPNGTYYTQGYKGQHIYIDSKNQLIIVRLGKDFGKMEWATFFQELSNKYEINTGYNNGYK
ncbi:serine hydrolase domain-containing protein [Polaribacter butkevichii]|uniref:Beta-lactamase-related domain-containing protein n=1 Tax=Polaribacter butkevichii TaxID=218490 RepID=A0A2P6C9R8_9FLAO|nr:serine hydrolase [Polaribacter butkevichii]PQJ69676.1 hypothetical protein BTO14_16930 [Polaribacter butkevichii]